MFNAMFGIIILVYVFFIPYDMPLKKLILYF